MVLLLNVSGLSACYRPIGKLRPYAVRRLPEALRSTAPHPPAGTFSPQAGRRGARPPSANNLLRTTTDDHGAGPIVLLPVQRGEGGGSRMRGSSHGGEQ